MIEWKVSRYSNAYTIKLSSTLTICVSQEIGTRHGLIKLWRVRVFECVLDARFDNPEDAKEYALAAARWQISLARERLSPLENLVVTTENNAENLLTG